MDLWVETYRGYLQAVAGMQPLRFFTLFRAAVTLWMCVSLCGLVFHVCLQRVPRGTLLALTWAACIAGSLLAMELPLEKFDPSRTLRGWIVAFSVLSIIALPWALAFFLAARAGWRKLLAAAMYSLMVLMFTLAIWRSAS